MLLCPDQIADARPIPLRASLQLMGDAPRRVKQVRLARNCPATAIETISRLEGVALAWPFNALPGLGKGVGGGKRVED
jgi:hypothetical protein